MGQLAEPTTAQQIQAGVAEREAAETALQGNPADRSGVESNQLQGQRDIEFNPANETGTAQGGSSGVASLPATGTNQTPAASQEWESVLDVAKQYGIDTTGYSDDRTFLNSLIQRAQQNQQADYYAQLGRQLAPQSEKIQQYLQTQKAPVAAEGPKPWEAPPYNPAWQALVQYDPASGIYLGKPGAPQFAVDGVNKYAQWKETYDKDPIAAVRPWAEQHVQTQVQEQVQKALAGYRREQAVNQIVQSNAEWMYQKDAAGNYLVGPGNRYVPTPHGLQYSQRINELERAGITDPHLADRYARMHVMAELSSAQERATNQAAPTGQAQNALAAGRQQSNVRQSRGTLAAPANEPAADLAGLSLAEQIDRNLSAAGFNTNADFNFDER